MKSLRDKVLRQSILSLPMAVLLTSIVGDAAWAQEEAPPPAAAPAPAAGFAVSSAPFGAAGQLAFSMASEGEFPFSFSKTGSSAWSLRLRPSLDYFIQEHLSVGGLIGIDKDGGGSVLRFGVRAGYDVPLGGIVSLWVRGGLDVARTSVNNGPSFTVTSLTIDVPFLFHFAPHFLLGVGPFFSVPLSNSAAMGSKDPTYGLTALVGGYF